MNFTVRLHDEKDAETIALLKDLVNKSSFKGAGTLTAEILRVALPLLATSPAFNREVAREAFTNLAGQPERPPSPQVPPPYSGGISEDPPPLEL